jgi:glutamyl-tRNA synthetase
VCGKLLGLPAFTPSDIEGVIRTVAESAGVSAGKLIHPLRLAVTGVSLGPGLFELMSAIGRDACIRRIGHALTVLG